MRLISALSLLVLFFSTYLLDLLDIYLFVFIVNSEVISICKHLPKVLIHLQIVAVDVNFRRDFGNSKELQGGISISTIH